MELVYIIDLLGTFVFAISGVLTAIRKDLDLFGAALIGGITAIGGGTLRDLLIGNTPVSWMEDLIYLAVIIAAVPICYLFEKQLQKLRKGIFLFDTLGIGLFTVIGVEKALAVDLSPVVAVMMGVVSAVFGGLMRDVLTNEVPLILRKEIYATACIIGALAFIGMETLEINHQVSIWLSVLIVAVIRYVSIRRKWSLVVKKQ